MVSKLTTLFVIIILLASTVYAGGDVITEFIAKDDAGVERYLFYEGESVTITAIAKAENKKATFYDLSMNIISKDLGKIIDFSDVSKISGKKGNLYSPLHKNEVNGQYIDDLGNYYGWWFFGTSASDLLELSVEQVSEIGSFSFIVPPLIAEKTIAFEYDYTNFIDYNNNFEEILLNIKTNGKSISLNPKCGGEICGSLQTCNLEINKCEGQASCSSNDDCPVGICLPLKQCTKGKVGDGCLTNKDCKEGNECKLNDGLYKCAKKEVGCPSGDPEDCDGDNIKDKDENKLCLTTPINLKKHVFPAGHKFAGCMKADINLDNQITIEDLDAFLSHYDKYVDNFPEATGTPINGAEPLNKITVTDLDFFLDFYDKNLG